MAARLRVAREEAGFASAAAAAREFGWNEATYRHHENGTRGYDSEQATAYAKYYGVSAGWLLGFSKEKDPDTIERTKNILYAFDLPSGEAKDLEDLLLDLTDCVLVRLLDLSALAQSGPSALYNNRNPFIAFSRKIVESSAKSTFREVVACYADGSDMHPTILDGSLILIDTGQQQPHHNDQIWLMSRAGRVLIRRLRFEDDSTAIASGDNAPHATFNIPLDEKFFYIHGRVVWIGQPAT